MTRHPRSWARAAGLARAGILVVALAGLGSCSRSSAVPPQQGGVVAPEAADAGPAPDRRSCVHRPAECGFPDATTTGVPTATVLVRVPQDATEGPGWRYDERGFIDVYGEDAVLDGISTQVGLSITGAGAVVRNSRIVVGGMFGVAVRHADGVTLEDNTITGSPLSGPNRLLVAVKDIYGDTSGLRVLRNDISGASTGVQMEAGLIEDNYVHDLAYEPGDHTNGTTSNGGSSLLVIRHNTVLNQHDQTDAVSLFQDFGPQRNRRIEDNLLAGGGYTIYAGANPGLESSATQIVVVGNRISRRYFPTGGSFGPATAWVVGPGNIWSGNVWDDTGRPVPPP